MDNRKLNMAADGASGVAVGIGIKSGAFAALGAAVVSLLAILIGFTVVPLTPGRELMDATRRLGAGLLSSFMIGPLVAIAVIRQWPEYLDQVHTLVGAEGAEGRMWEFLIAATPFIAITGVLGFWIVAALMRFFTKREGKDVLDMYRDVAKGQGDETPR